MKNPLIRAGVALCLKKNNAAQKPHYLVISTTGLGDTLWATPALRAIKKHQPDSTTTLLTSPIGASLLAKNPYIDHCFVVKDPVFSQLAPMRRTLKALKPTAAIVFHTSQRPILPLVKTLGCSQIVGTKGINKGFDDYLTIQREPRYEHEITRRLKLIDQLGIPADGYAMDLFIDESIDNLSGEPIIVLHPGAKDPFKQWHPRHFIEVGRQLCEHGEIIVTGNSSEKKLAGHIAQSIPGAQSLAGALSLSQLAHVLRRSRVVITNDTGPMHMACALKNPVIALFGPTDPKLCGPLEVENTTTLQAPKTCHPCLTKKCQSPFCMSLIKPTSVVSCALNYLSSNTINSPMRCSTVCGAGASGLSVDRP